jgi:hypothetical protein
MNGEHPGEEKWLRCKRPQDSTPKGMLPVEHEHAFPHQPRQPFNPAMGRLINGQIMVPQGLPECIGLLESHREALAGDGIDGP